MRRTSLRFTIRSMMITVAIVAVFLGLYELMGDLLLVALFGVAYVCLIGLLWWMFRDFRRLSALCLGISAGATNFSCFLLCIYLANLDGFVVALIIWFATLPLILGAGSAWALKSTRRNAVGRRSPLWVWPLVVGLAVLPLTMVITLWPLWLAFRVSQPALERLADRVANGQVLVTPEWAGLIRVVGSAVDSATGNVGLVVDPNPNGRSGFVRLGPGVPPGQTAGPFFNQSVNSLGGRWSYQEED
jgi:hypothetical protein